MSAMAASLCPLLPTTNCSRSLKKRQIRAAGAAASGIDLDSLESAIVKKDGAAVKQLLDGLSEVGWARKWCSQPHVSRRTTSLRELSTLGIKNAENLAIPSVRNDAAFLFTLVGTTGFLALLTGQLPGDWGFFVPYLIGSIPLIALAVGSVSPGLLQAAISGFSSFFPEYKQRIARHEAAHFLGLPLWQWLVLQQKAWSMIKWLGSLLIFSLFRDLSTGANHSLAKYSNKILPDGLYYLLHHF